MPRINFMLKVQDAKMTEIKKALEKANIKVISIYEVFKEKPAAPTGTSRAASQAASSGSNNGGSSS